jgi:prephenate dehydrogenase
LVDSTRLALSSFDIWGDILDTNRRQILVALEAYISKLEEFREGLSVGAIRRQFDAAARLAVQVRDRT